MGAVFISVVKLFIMIFAGFAARKLGVLDQQVTKGLASILVKVTLPLFIFTSMQKDYSPGLLKESLVITALSFGVYGLYFIIAVITGRILRGDERDTGVYQFAILFSNVGFMGFPVLSSVFGDESIFYAAMFNIPFHFFVFTVGVYLMTRGHAEDARFDPKLLLSPGIVMTIAGFICFVCGIRLPGLIFDPVKYIGDITIPLSMIMVGSLLTEVHYSEFLSGWRVYFITLMRLAVLPLAVFFFVRIFTSSPMLISVPVVIAAMPVAVNAPLIAQEYQGNSLLASRLLIVSTFLSLFTLPVVLLLLKAVL